MRSGGEKKGARSAERGAGEKQTKIEQDRLSGCLIGLAVGDAVGTALEFKPRGSFEPITDMVGGGPFGLKPGQWTDDTSMALCLAQSLIHCREFDAKDQMERYCDWYRNGYMSSTGECFDIGMATSAALRDFESWGDVFAGSLEATSAGNGCIMRLAPVPIFYHRDFEQAIFYAGESSRTTHGAMECIDASRLFCAMIVKAFSANEKTDVISAHGYSAETAKVSQIAAGEFLQKTYESLTGSGYVIESLESALWCFFNTNSFEQAILAAANIGNDADTTAAICGQIAGAFYGLSNIPESWRKKLTMYAEITQMAEQLSTGSV